MSTFHRKEVSHLSCVNEISEHIRFVRTVPEIAVVITAIETPCLRR